MNNIKPFIKWAGGKSQLLAEIRAKYPDKIERYCEPFVGGGAVLFDVLANFKPREVLINDINAELVNTYIQIRDNVDGVLKLLSKYQSEYHPMSDDKRKTDYYSKRERFNKLKVSCTKNELVEQAALFIFLNKTCFNGLYRVNGKGQFNVPIGSYKMPPICDEENLQLISGLLSGVDVRCGEYKNCIDFIDAKTFVYIDPPYRPITATSSFTSYSENEFGDTQQIELCEFIDRISEKGAKVVASNSDPKNADKNDNFFDDLYINYSIQRVSAKRMINSAGGNRGNISELLICNFSRCEMDELSQFVNDLLNKLGTTSETLSIVQAREVVRRINEFLYNTYPGIGTTIELGNEFAYFSDFHKYWEKHYSEIIDAQIDENNCTKVAEALHSIYKNTNGKAFSDIYDTCGLTPEQVCRVRFLTANQDFRGSRSFNRFAEIFTSDNSIFDEEKIANDPEGFVKDIGITDLSQSDKRIRYAQNVAEFLLEKNISPYELPQKYNNDIRLIKKAIVNIASGGYGNKKTDMFIRDMVVLGVWKDCVGFDSINVASDINTVKVALRTGIIKTAIPLVSSFLDIFCYQYSCIDDINAKAWRRVWEIWSEKYPNETVSSPCLLDYFVYNVIGKQFCKNILHIFECEKYGHTFAWHSAKNRTCQLCYSNGEKHVKARLISAHMPCLSEQGDIAIQATEYVKNLPNEQKISYCPFIAICNENNSHRLQPPKSISIMGQTGWNSAYANRGEGGGGLMS